MISTPFKNISQNGNLPQIGVKIKNVWNRHHFLSTSFSFSLKRYTLRDDQTNTHQKLPGRVVLSKPVPHPFFGGFKFQASWKMSRSSKRETTLPNLLDEHNKCPSNHSVLSTFLGAHQVSWTKMLETTTGTTCQHISGSLIFQMEFRKSSPVREGNSQWKFPALWLLRQRNLTSLNSKGNQTSLHLYVCKD